MRIAVSGTHRSGKSTLISELAASLPEYGFVDEPYLLLEADGHTFSHPPSPEDFEAQLARSIEELGDTGSDVVFDRCPVDILAYILVHEEGDAFEIEEWLPQLRAAVRTLDLIVFLPIETPDPITPASSDDDDGFRDRVDERLRELLLDDSLDLGLDVLEVEGTVERRVETVLGRVR